MLLSVHTPPEMRKNIQTPDSSLGEEFSTAFHEDVLDFPKPWKLVVVAWQILGGFPIRRRPCPELGARKWLISWMLRGISVVAMGNALFANYTSYVTVNFQLGEGAYLKNALNRVSLLIMTLSSLPCILHGLLSARRLSRFINTLLLLIRELQPANQPGKRAL
ncbi:uncharacterized protein LOC117645214 [Thrips palmi]|uniref:Uncharacterized protein LOC117645214 n=1 Tax=Thrips palmi TaxID=161013 RepID=A0A6P8Z3H3_THRPL|nr:uncharacterized protein LOC117645214 [Thrips palmi]